MSVTDDQQFCLRWNNFQAYITSQFEALRDDEDFVDVTLACDGQRLGAHKVVLSACSPFFKELFKSNPCPHPIIFMRDVEVRHVIALLEFMYAGEVNVAQAHLAGFLRTAESLQIRGLTDASKNQKDNNDQLFTESQPSSTQFTRSTSPRGQKIKPKPQNSPSRAVTSTQEKILEETSLLSPPPCKKICKTDRPADRNDRTDRIDRNDRNDRTDRIDRNDRNERIDLENERLDLGETDEEKAFNAQINPFAIQSSKTLHSELDITSDLIEPKIELPDYSYSEDETNQENSHSFLDTEVKNSFGNIAGGMEIIPGTSGMADISQDTQQAWDNRKLHSLDPRPCPVCARVYSNLSNLRQHMRLIHNPTHVACPVCAKTFKTALYLKRHLVGCRASHGRINGRATMGKADGELDTPQGEENSPYMGEEYSYEIGNEMIKDDIVV